MSSLPKGCIAVLTGPDGRVEAHAADFAPDHPGGCTILEGQRHRARIGVALNLVRSHCSSVVSKAFGTYEAERTLDVLCAHHKFTLTYIPIGHGEVEK